MDGRNVVGTLHAMSLTSKPNMNFSLKSILKNNLIANFICYLLKFFRGEL
jgi:hypothetical protein